MLIDLNALRRAAKGKAEDIVPVTRGALQLLLAEVAAHRKAPAK